MAETSADTAVVSAEALAAFVDRAGRRVGLEGDDLGLFVDAITETDLRGIDSHGVFRVPFYCRGFANGAINARPKVRTKRSFGATRLLDADNGLGVIIGQRAMVQAVDLARDHGIGLVAVRNSNHSGMLAMHVLRASREGMIGWFVSNAPALMAPWGGREPLLSNSPFAYAIPTGTEQAIVLDMACSAVARGKIRLAAQKNERIPLGWAIDADGMPVEDAHAAMKGAVVAMAGYKGYAIAFVNELLSAALPGAKLSMDVSRSFLKEGATALDSWGVGHLAMAINIKAFADPAEFEGRVARFVEEIHKSPLAAGHERILVPGEPEFIAHQERAITGIPLAGSIVRSLRTFAADIGIEALV